MTIYQRLGSWNNKHSFLTVLETGSPWSRCQYGHVLVKTFFLVYSHVLTVYPHLADKEQEVWSLTLRTLIPFTRAPSSWPNYTSQVSSLNTITLGIRVSTYEFGGDTDIQSTVSLHWLRHLIKCVSCQPSIWKSVVPFRDSFWSLISFMSIDYLLTVSPSPALGRALFKDAYERIRILNAL